MFSLIAYIQVQDGNTLVTQLCEFNATELYT